MKTYTTTRYDFLPKRKLVWEEICRYLNRHFISEDASVLELGSGYGDFIGNILAKERVAIEKNIFFKKCSSNYLDITVHWADALSALKKIPKQSFDVVFCSNYFEHFELPEIQDQLDMISDILKPGGKLLVLQPNYQLCSKLYFDDWTHKSIFSHISFSDLLETHGFYIDKCMKKFLPFSMKSRFPINRLLVRFYLKSPIKPFAGQFLIVALLTGERK